MDCRGDELIQHNNRTSAQAVPFQYLINEQAKSILALQELQNEVGALLEFRDLVMDTFPHLRQKQVSSPEPSSGSQGVGSGESRWEPGVRVRRKLGSSSGWIAGGGLATGGGGGGTGPRSRCNSHGKGPKSGEPATTSVGTVQDSGFCTESKDSSSTSSRTTATMTKTGGVDGGGGGSGGGSCGSKDDEDELWSLLEVIQDKGTKLKLEAEFLQSRLLDDERLRRGWRPQFRRCRSLDDLLQRPAVLQRQDVAADDYCDYDVFRAHVTDLKRERDALLDRVTEMEAESLSNAAQIHRLLVELKSVVCENRELEERLCGGGGGVGGLGAKSSSSATSTAKKSSSHNGGGFAPVQPESSTTGPSSSSAGRDAYYTPSQHSACNLSSIELQCKQCPSAASSTSSAASSLSAATTDDNLLLNRHHHHHHHHNNHHRSRRMLLVRPSDPISRNLEGRTASPPQPQPPPPPPVDIGSPTFAKRLGALDGIVSSPAERIGKPVPGCGPTAGTPLPRGTLAAILKTFNPIELQRHLITVSYENKNLVRQVEILSKSKSDVTDELNRSKDDNEELKFQLEEKRIELEGTMARVRLLQLHQEQQQHGPNCGGGAVGQQQSTTTTTNQWLDLVPSNPILPQIALPGTPVQSAASPSHHHHQNSSQQQQLHNNSNTNSSNNNNNNHHHLQHHHQDENGGSSSTESAHQARSGGKHNQPSKIPVVKSYSSRPPSSYRDPHHHHHHQQPANRDPYPSWNKCKSDQSYPRNWDPIGNGGKSNGSASSIGSGGGGGGGGSSGKTYRNRQQDSLQDGGSKQHLQHRTSRRDSGSGGGTSLTRAKSQSNHHLRSAANCNPADNRTSCKDLRAGGGTAVAVAPSAGADDTNKPAKKLFRRRNLVRQSHCLIDQKKLVLPAVDEVQEPPDSMAAAAQLRDFRRDDGDRPEDDCRRGDDDDDEFFFDSIESSLATSASSRRPPPECDSIDLSQPDSSLTIT